MLGPPSTPLEAWVYPSGRALAWLALGPGLLLSTVRADQWSHIPAPAPARSPLPGHQPVQALKTLAGLLAITGARKPPELSG